MGGREHRSPVAVVGGGMDWTTTNWLARLGGGGGGGGGQFGSFSYESENDLSVMVSDFLENGSCGADSRYSSDSDSSFSDLADKILLYKHSVDDYESDLLSAICTSKWQGFGHIPGGEHEFIDVITHFDGGCSGRYIIDIDFHSHFEIARAVESYDAVLNSLPVVYVGSLSKLKQFLQSMVDAARCSLKQNSMPLPPWRSLAYLAAKWESTSQRVVSLYEQNTNRTYSYSHQHCIGLLRRLKSCIQSEIKAKELLTLTKNGKKGRPKPERWRHSSFRTPVKIPRFCWG
ncbi:hypothetical protein F0562_021949 [Nyssa sinensis]|uniref:Uncharacterized protein n=1 Tax=Nyssa sinensis TaxID=561372 RepID=A0A5J5BMG7_9ASTE|nr:hypothetical protein F0562_021949 [Nyssa sinensis]